jgi:hypothetical protein
LAGNIKWTTDLGNAFLAQQNDVMDAVQRMRAKAKDAGNLKSNEQMKVETKVVESKTVVVIEQASPQVVYVPSYNPTVVYGPPCLSLSAYCLSVDRSRRRGNGNFVRHRCGDGGGVGWRLGLPLPLGRQQQHHDQQQQQFRKQFQPRQQYLQSTELRQPRDTTDLGFREHVAA